MCFRFGCIGSCEKPVHYIEKSSYALPTCCIHDIPAGMSLLLRRSTRQLLVLCSVCLCPLVALRWCTDV